MLSVAVVVLNWNGLHLLEQFAPHWVAHTPKVAELIVADNGSTDNSVAYLRKAHPQVRIIELGHNWGFAEGYNRVLAQLTHDIVVLLNSDATPSAGWLDEPLKLLASDKRLVAVQPKIRSWREPQRFEYAGAAGGYLDPLGYPYCRGRVLSWVETDHGQYDTRADITWVSGAALIIRREAYLEVGGLDTRFFAHQEEIDLCWRLRARGWRMACAPSSVVYHLGGATLDMEHPRKTYLNFRNNLLMLYKNLPNLRLGLTLALRLPLDTLALGQMLVQGKWQHAGSVIRAWIDALKLMPSYRTDRLTNLRLAIISPSQILSPKLLLWLALKLKAQRHQNV